VPFLPLGPGSRNWGKISRSGSGINISDHISESLETTFWVKILKFFDADPGSGMEKMFLDKIRKDQMGLVLIIGWAMDFF
jgi:hypothetical protein